MDFVYAERFGVIEAAREKGIGAFGNMEDQSEMAPDTVVTSVVWDMWPSVKEFVTLVQNGSFVGRTTGIFPLSRRRGSICPVRIVGREIPEDVKAMLESERRRLPTAAS